MISHISKDHLEEVVEYLLQKKFPISIEDKSHIVIISDRLSSLSKQILQNTINSEDAQQERSRIRVALLKLIS